MQYTADQIMGHLADSKELPRVWVVELRAHDSAWNPASTKNLLYGPAILVYTLHKDGAITASTMELPDGPK